MKVEGENLKTSMQSQKIKTQWLRNIYDLRLKKIYDRDVMQLLGNKTLGWSCSITNSEMKL